MKTKPIESIFQSSIHCGIILLTSFPLVAQNNVFRHVTTRSGLPSGYINQIEQDSLGFMWFATEQGLSKYDGYTFTNYQEDEDDPGAIGASNIFWFKMLDEQKMLVSHISGLDIFHIDENRFSPVSVASSVKGLDTLRAVLFDKHGAMWTGGLNQLYHIPNPDFSDTLKGAIYSFEDENYVIRSLAEFKGQIYVGTDAGLYLFDQYDKKFIAIRSDNKMVKQAAESQIWEMLTGPDGNLYIATFLGLLRIQADTGELEFVSNIGSFSDQELIDFKFQDMMVDSDDNLWLGGAFFGAVKWNLKENSFTEYRPEDENVNTVHSPDIHYIYEDREGNMWFGYHYLGASIMYDKSWNYTLKQPFPELQGGNPKNTILDIFTDDKETIWATAGNGLIKNLGSENQTYYAVDKSDIELPENLNLLQTLIATNGDDFYLTPGRSVNVSIPYFVIFNRKTESFRLQKLPELLELTPLEGLKYKGFLYIGHYNDRTLTKMNLSTGEFETIPVPVEQIYTDATVVVTSTWYMDGSELFVKVYSLGLPESDIIQHFIYNVETGEFRTQDITIDYPIRTIQAPLRSTVEPGVMYINSSTGLIRVDNINNSYSVTFEDNMDPLRKTIRLMTQDNQGYIWLNNDEGLIRVDPLTETVDYFELPRDKYRPYYAFPRTLPDGEIIFAGVNSYVRFNPADLESTQPVGTSIITSLQTGSEIYDLTYSSIEPEIPSEQNSITFNFIGLDFKDPASVNYRYRILGSENDQWNSVGTQRSVFIPNLEAGDYTFEVQSGSQSGTFNETTASINFAVLPPWWNTIPAYLLYVILLAGGLYSVDRIQRKRLARKERERTQEKELEQAKKIEKAYHDLEKAHEQLKSAQQQLVQQEKLASLGQLTAGIAHEIKNPLNFVNNFSDLSIELVEEAEEELSAYSLQLKADSDTQNLSEAKEILNDVKANLRKIHEHGTRADSIVKSMLQHSRGGTGKMEPTDLNALVKEYVNLSFHGMRASKEPINVDIQLDLDEQVGEVPLIGEDFSRVIVNLCNNAFDAMREKQNSEDRSQDSGGFSPTLTARTKVVGDRVQIEIEDNGPGISEEMKDKIFQPFFTTKKGTEGTGLGLSITNDIIKAHGGELEVRSEPGEGTTFSINIQQNK
jgi:signal transduction histidine kinase/ligand-binding sensor domain-containing protein